MTKAELYRMVDCDRESWGMKSGFGRGICVSAERLSLQLGLTLRSMDFETPGLRGVAVPGCSLTVISEGLSSAQRNFFLAHELFHHLHHAGLPQSSFHCYETRDSALYYEWEANEGAAELLVPYRDVLYLVGSRRIESHRDLYRLQYEIAQFYHVPRATAHLRFESLKYEIAQCRAGVPPEEVRLLSAAGQDARGLDVPSLNALFPAPKSAVAASDIWAGDDEFVGSYN